MAEVFGGSWVLILELLMGLGFEVVLQVLLTERNLSDLSVGVQNEIG